MGNEADFIELMIKLNKKERKAFVNLVRERDKLESRIRDLNHKIQGTYQHLLDKYTLVPDKEPRVKPHNKPTSRRR